MVAVLGFIALIVVPVLLKMAVKLIAYGVGRLFLNSLGRQALDQQPDALELKRDGATVWRDAARIESLARPLLNAGFGDCGVYVTDKMPGIRIWFLMKEADGVAAFIYEHPKTSPWIELSVRYNDGSTTALSNLPPTGIDMNPPFFKKITADGAVPTDQLYQRILKERSPYGIKNVNRQTVVAEYEQAYMRIMTWQKNKGLSPEEVAAVVKKWSEKRDASGGGA